VEDKYWRYEFLAMTEDVLELTRVVQAFWLCVEAYDTICLEQLTVASLLDDVKRRLGEVVYGRFREIDRSRDIL
jgi:hypothetical protein